MLRSIGKQSGESVESVQEKTMINKGEATTNKWNHLHKLIDCLTTKKFKLTKTRHSHT